MDGWSDRRTKRRLYALLSGSIIRPRKDGIMCSKFLDIYHKDKSCKILTSYLSYFINVEKECKMLEMICLPLLK